METQIFYVLLLIHFCVLSVLVVRSLINLAYIKAKTLKKGKSMGLNCSVIIPARNEGKNIDRCLKSILNSPIDDFVHEIIVVDDCSTDDTGSIVEKYSRGSQKIKIKLLSSGNNAFARHNRKAISLQKGVDVATGEWLLFLDADVWLDSSEIHNKISSYTSDKNTITSYIPKHFPDHWWEKAWLGPYLLLNAATYELKKMYDPSTNYAILIGACWLVNKKTFLDVGGYKSLSHEIVEDYALSELFKKRGYVIQLVDGTDGFCLKNYESIERLISSALKGITTMDISMANRFLLLFGYTLMSLMPMLVLAIIRNSLFLPLGLYVFISMFIYKILKNWSSQEWWSYMIYPLGYLLFAWLFMRSIIDVTRNEVRWSGHTYKLN